MKNLTNLINLTNPDISCLSLYCSSSYNVKFGIIDNSITNTTNNNNNNNINNINSNNINNKYKWSYNNNYIYNLEHELYLSIQKNKLVVSRYRYKLKNKLQWIIENNYIKHIKSGLYIACNYEYIIYLTLDKVKAIQFHIENNYIHFIKSEFLIKFELNNIKNNVKLNRFMLRLNKLKNIPNHPSDPLQDPLPDPFNICILLSAGTSSRFVSNINKQLYILDNKKPVITFSIETIIDYVDKLIIITNSKCYNEIVNLPIIKLQRKNFTSKNSNSKIIVLKNDINCRLESINTGLQYINKYYKNNKSINLSNIIIHDAARPHIKKEYIENLLINSRSINNTLYSQYYLKLINGLMNIDIDNGIHEIVDRDKYIELCTPLCINYHIFDFIFKNYMDKENRITNEFIPIMKLLDIKYNFIEGHYKYLRKITTIDDV